MKGSLEELIVEASSNLRLLQVHFSEHSAEIEELRAAEVSAHRIAALYPFDPADYTRKLGELEVELDAKFPSLSRAIAQHPIESLEFLLEFLLPSDMVEEAAPVRVRPVTAASMLLHIVYYCHHLAAYNPANAIIGDESETESANEWADALHYFRKIGSLLDELSQHVLWKRAAA